MDDVEAFASQITQDSDVMFVGHLPFLDRLVSFLVTGNQEKSVFEFLWHYLKTLDLPKHDRISFLNSFQLLIEKIQLREKPCE